MDAISSVICQKNRFLDRCVLISNRLLTELIQLYILPWSDGAIDRPVGLSDFVLIFVDNKLDFI